MCNRLIVKKSICGLNRLFFSVIRRFTRYNVITLQCFIDPSFFRRENRRQSVIFLYLYETFSKHCCHCFPVKCVLIIDSHVHNTCPTRAYQAQYWDNCLKIYPMTSGDEGDKEFICTIINNLI